MQIFLPGDKKRAIPHWVIGVLVASVFVIPGITLVVRLIREYCI